MGESNGTGLGAHIAAGTIAALASLVLAPAAPASSNHPKGEFSQFGECPLSRETITDCVYSVSSGGLLQIGEREVPLIQPITLQGGYEGSGKEVKFYGAENGETLSPMPQPVPGGLWGAVALAWWPKWLQKSYKEPFDEALTSLTATIELAGPATDIGLNTENLLGREGRALGLPVKIKLNTPILGNRCYIGSSSKPVQIELSTGTSGGVKGFAGEISNNKEFTLLTVNGGEFVDGTFAVPTASGCGGIYSFFIDPLVNSILGLPSGSGGNTAVLEGVLEDAAAEAVRESE